MNKFIVENILILVTFFSIKKAIRNAQFRIIMFQRLKNPEYFNRAQFHPYLQLQSHMKKKFYFIIKSRFVLYL